MKKILFIGTAVAIAMGFSSCQKENITEGQASEGLIKETFSAGFEQTATKTTISDDAATVNWAANDKVYYYSKDGGAVRSFTIPAAGASASLTLEREEGDTYYNLVYAGNTEPTFTTRTGTSMVFEGVKSAQDGTFQSANISVGRTTPGGSGITFKPVTALVKFSTARTDIKTIVLTGGNGEKVAGSISVNPTAASPVAALDGDGSTTITVTIGTPAAGTYYINVLPGTYDQGLKLTLKNTSGAVIGTVTASKSTNLSAGDSMINYGDVDSHIVPPVLLSGKFSVSATKQVQFTRGNLYWNGTAWGLETSQTDYPTVWSTSHVSHLFWTKDAANSYAESYNESTSAAKTDKFFADGSDADHSLTIEDQSGLYALSSAEWTYLISTRTSASGLYKYGVTVTNGGTIYTNCLIIAPDDFTGTLEASYTLDEVNASGLVCLPAASYRTGSSLASGGSYGSFWSATPHGSSNGSAYNLSFNDNKVDLSGYDYRNIGSSVRLVKGTVSYPEAPALACLKIGNVTWAPVNCGYDATHTYGLLYQWGRKYGQGYDEEIPAVSKQNSQLSTVAAGSDASNKDNFYYGEAVWTSVETRTSDYWFTTYNPCPAGWRVPTYAELNALLGGNSSPSITTVGSQKGCYFNGNSSASSGVFLPAAGYRGCYGANAYSRGENGAYWSSLPNTENVENAMYLNFSDCDAGMEDYQRANGYSVRCVKE